MKKKLLKYVLVLSCLAFGPRSFAVREVTFLTEDGVNVTADLYFKGNDFPYILLFHQDGSSRGEFPEIAKRLIELNYNCLAIDLRSGGSINYVENQTAGYAKNNGFVCDYSESGKDVKAAIEYAFKKSGQAVVLFGSNFSATLCIKHCINNGRVSAVVAFDPGEYLQPGYVLHDDVKNIDKPVFIACKKSTSAYTRKLFETADAGYLTFFSPSNDKGQNGAKALWPRSENNKEYWLALLMFFSKL